MTTGITMPPEFLVAALNSLQKAMMLTPCWPSAGPTGGAGLACPPGICNLMMPVTFLAIKPMRCFGNPGRRFVSQGVPAPLLPEPSIVSCFFDLPVFEFHRRVAAENVDRDF